MKTLFGLLLSFIAIASFAIETPSNRYGMVPGKAAFKSAGAMTMGPDGIIFIADPKSASVFALDLKDNTRDTTSTAIEIKSIDRALAGFLGINTEDVVINDLVVNPLSQNIYLSVSRGRSVDAIPVLIKVSHQGKISEVKTDNVLFSRADIANAPGPDEKTPWGELKRNMVIIDLNYYGGELFVAGLSNEEFSSNLRRLSFPFNASASTSVEIFHTSHNRFEAHAPITTMLPLMLNNQPAVIAGYGCAPLAKFSLADLKEKKHVKGTTLAELGGGSRPIDIVLFNRNGEDRILIANSNRSVYTMKVSDLEKSQPLTTAVDDIFVSSGTPYVATAYVGVMQIDNLNKKFIAAIQRDIQTGALDLISIQKRWL